MHPFTSQSRHLASDKTVPIITMEKFLVHIALYPFVMIVLKQSSLSFQYEYRFFSPESQAERRIQQQTKDGRYKFRTN